MKRLATAILIGVLTLSACGGGGASSQHGDAPSANDWFTSVDPETGKVFRCTLWWKKQGYGGGLASFCYDKNEVNR